MKKLLFCCSCLLALFWVPAAYAVPDALVDKAMQAKSVSEVVTLLGISAPEPGKRILLEVPEISSAGAKVPVKVLSQIPGTDWIAVLVERNNTPLALVKEFSPGTDRTVTLTVALTQTSRVRAVVRAGGKYYQVTHEVKVASDGCPQP